MMLSSDNKITLASLWWINQCMWKQNCFCLCNLALRVSHTTKSVILFGAPGRSRTPMCPVNLSTSS